MLRLEAAKNEDLDIVARQILANFSKNRIFALYGAMGAGKTTLVKSLCKVLEVEDVALSPTFALINEYRRKKGEPVYHFDFYRINNISEAYDMGYEEYFYSGNYCFIEWPEKIEQLLPPGFVYISIQVNQPDQKRIISVH